MVSVMIRKQTLSIALVCISLLSGVQNLCAQSFLDELFGPDESASSRRASGRNGVDAGAHGGRGGLDHGHAGRGEHGQLDGGRENDGASFGSGTEFCVRTCDGYFFPLIKSAQQTKQASCEYACPSAPVAYYHGASIESARNLKGEKYTALPTAFKFREKVSQGCTCHPPEESQENSLKIVGNDPTAHSGDIVVGQKGALVYQGKQAIPIDRSRQLSATQRQNIQRMTAGPLPAGSTHSSTQDAQAGAPAETHSETSGETSGGGAVLSGAATPMGEIDAANTGPTETNRDGLTTSPGLMILLALGALAVIGAAFKLLPAFKNRTTAQFKDEPTSGEAGDRAAPDTSEAALNSPNSLAWVWSEYRGVI